MVGFDWTILKMLSTVKIKWKIQADGFHHAKFFSLRSYKGCKVSGKILHGSLG